MGGRGAAVVAGGGFETSDLATGTGAGAGFGIIITGVAAGARAFAGGGGAVNEFIKCCRKNPIVRLLRK